MISSCKPPAHPSPPPAAIPYKGLRLQPCTASKSRASWSPVEPGGRGARTAILGHRRRRGAWEGGALTAMGHRLRRCGAWGRPQRVPVKIFLILYRYCQFLTQTAILKRKVVIYKKRKMLCVG